jgi:hypothetical protein
LPTFLTLTVSVCFSPGRIFVGGSGAEMAALNAPSGMGPVARPSPTIFSASRTFPPLSVPPAPPAPPVPPPPQPSTASAAAKANAPRAFLICIELFSFEGYK